MIIKKQRDKYYLIDEEMLNLLCGYCEHLHHVISTICKTTNDKTEKDKSYLQKIRKTVLMLKNQC